MLEKMIIGNANLFYGVRNSLFSLTCNSEQSIIMPVNGVQLMVV